MSNARKSSKSDAFEAIHSSASTLHKIGAIDKTTMTKFDVSCLAMPVEITKIGVRLQLISHKSFDAEQINRRHK